MSPYTAQDLPFSGSTPASRHASWRATQRLTKRRGPQVRRYLDLLTTGDFTDLEAADALGLQRSSINSIRNSRTVRELVVPYGYRLSRFGEKNTVWRLARR